MVGFVFNQTNLLEQQCAGYCNQILIDLQYSAVANIYNNFSYFILGIAFAMFIHFMIEKAIRSAEVGCWKIFNKKFVFILDDKKRKYLKMADDILLSVFFAFAVFFYVIYGYIASLGY